MGFGICGADECGSGRPGGRRGGAFRRDHPKDQNQGAGNAGRGFNRGLRGGFRDGGDGSRERVGRLCTQRGDSGGADSDGPGSKGGLPAEPERAEESKRSQGRANHKNKHHAWPGRNGSAALGHAKR